MDRAGRGGWWRRVCSSLILWGGRKGFSRGCGHLDFLVAMSVSTGISWCYVLLSLCFIDTPFFGHVLHNEASNSDIVLSLRELSAVVKGCLPSYKITKSSDVFACQEGGFLLLLWTSFVYIMFAVLFNKFPFNMLGRCQAAYNMTIMAPLSGTSGTSAGLCMKPFQQSNLPSPVKLISIVFPTGRCSFESSMINTMTLSVSCDKMAQRP